MARLYLRHQHQCPPLRQLDREGLRLMLLRLELLHLWHHRQMKHAHHSCAHGHFGDRWHLSVQRNFICFGTVRRVLSNTTVVYGLGYLTLSSRGLTEVAVTLSEHFGVDVSQLARMRRARRFPLGRSLWHEDAVEKLLC